MDYKLVSKMIFQSFIQNGVNVINSTPMLKGLIIAYLLENSIVYNDTDVNGLVVEVMKFLTVEDVVQSESASQVSQEQEYDFELNKDQLLSLGCYQLRIDTIKSKLSGILKEINEIVDDNNMVSFLNDLDNKFWEAENSNSDHLELFEKIDGDFNALEEVKQPITFLLS